MIARRCGINQPGSLAEGATAAGRLWGAAGRWGYHTLFLSLHSAETAPESQLPQLVQGQPHAFQSVVIV